MFYAELTYRRSPLHPGSGGPPLPRGEQLLQLSGVRSDGHVFPVDIMLARMVVPKGIYNLALVRHTPRQHGHELRVEYTVETDVKNDAVYA